MDARVAKELLHIQHWLEVAASIATKGKDAYDTDEIAQEAGDSLMIKIGEAAKTLAARGLVAPAGVSWSDAATEPREARPSLLDHRPRGDLADALRLAPRVGDGARAAVLGSGSDARCR